MPTHIDLETYSECELKRAGLYRYAEDPTTRVTLLGYALDDGPAKVIDLYHGEPLPAELRERLDAPDEILWAHNAQFERVLLWRAMRMRRMRIPPERWRCTMVWARSLALPAGLGPLAKELRTPHQKLDGDRKLITALCTPKKGGIQKNIALWPEFKQYNAADVEVERDIGRKLARFPMPAREWRLWFTDQKINDRGMPIDRDFVERCARTAEANANEVIDEVKLRTEMLNPRSRAQWLAWLRTENVEAEDLKAGTVDRMRKDEALDEDVRDLLDLRRELAATSLSKLDTLKAAVCSDGRLRGTLTFLGAPRTGRWSGKLFQPQNLPRGVLKELEIALARALAMDGDVGMIRTLWGEVSPVLASLIRTAIAAPAGRKLACPDLSSIETVMLGWASGCRSILRVFEEGRDSYRDFGSKYIFHVPYDQITKAQRNLSKPAVLGCGYGMGARGLQAYARSFGVELTLEEAGRHVRAYRAAYPEVVQFWDDVEAAAFSAVETGQAQRVGPFGFRKTGPFLFIDLPSGRSLAYYRPFVGDGRYGRELRYLSGAEYGNKIWLSSYGPKLCIAAGTPVLTGRGWVPIERVLPRDVVWDGVNWVETAGSKYNGRRETIQCYGVSMTPDHEVRTAAGWRRADETTGLDREEVPLPFGYSVAERADASVRSAKREEPIYDLINCGPLQRFTVRGIDGRLLLVHNCENIVQAIARDKLADGIENAVAEGIDVIFHVHDEIPAEADEGDTTVLDRLTACMTRPSIWCPDAPISASGWEGKLYRKD